MLSLDDGRWSVLRHAYGPATDIPAALAALKASPGTEDRDLWELLWSALNHQGDVYSASFAAVPHVIDAISQMPGAVSWQCFAFIASIEVERAAASCAIPEFLAADYALSWHRIPPLIGAAFSEPRSSLHTRCVLAALAASQQQPGLAELLLEADESELPAMLAWWRDR